MIMFTYTKKRLLGLEFTPHTVSPCNLNSFYATVGHELTSTALFVGSDDQFIHFYKNHWKSIKRFKEARGAVNWHNTIHPFYGDRIYLIDSRVRLITIDPPKPDLTPADPATMIFDQTNPCRSLYKIAGERVRCELCTGHTGPHACHDSLTHQIVAWSRDGRILEVRK